MVLDRSNLLFVLFKFQLSPATIWVGSRRTRVCHQLVIIVLFLFVRLYQKYIYILSTWSFSMTILSEVSSDRDDVPQTDEGTKQGRPGDASIVIHRGTGTRCQVIEMTSHKLPCLTGQKKTCCERFLQTSQDRTQTIWLITAQHITTIIDYVLQRGRDKNDARKPRYYRQKI